MLGKEVMQGQECWVRKSGKVRLYKVRNVG